MCIISIYFLYTIDALKSCESIMKTLHTYISYIFYTLITHKKEKKEFKKLTIMKNLHVICTLISHWFNYNIIWQCVNSTICKPKYQNAYENIFIFHYHRLFCDVYYLCISHNFELVLGVYLILLTSIGVNIKTFQKSNNQLIFGYFKPLY